MVIRGGGGQDEESEGGEHAYDSGALLKGRRVNGGAEGDRAMNFVRRVSVHLVVIDESCSSDGTSQNSLG